jgi:hypothetical protein
MRIYELLAKSGTALPSAQDKACSAYTAKHLPLGKILRQSRAKSRRPG